MKKIYDWDAKPCERNHTVADLKARKGKNMGVLSQTTANTEEEAKAASEAGIDSIMCNAEKAKVARQGAPTLFLTAALALPDYPTQNDVLRGAFKAMKAGADSIYTARGPHIVELLAREDIPVMCHLGLVPRKSSWRGGLRAIGKDIDEAKALMQDFLDMESAGAFSVEAECIVSEVMTLINERTPLLTSSLGSGGCADIIYLFQRDICGEEKNMPKHATAFGDISVPFRPTVHKITLPGIGDTSGRGEYVMEEPEDLSRFRTPPERRVEVLKLFDKAVKSGAFPSESNLVTKFMPREIKQLSEAFAKM